MVEVSCHFSEGQDPFNKLNLELTRAAVKKVVVRLHYLNDEDAEDVKEDMYTYLGLWCLSPPVWHVEDEEKLERLLDKHGIDSVEDRAHFAMFEKPHLRFHLTAIPINYDDEGEWKLLEVNRGTRVLIGSNSSESLDNPREIVAIGNKNRVKEKDVVDNWFRKGDWKKFESNWQFQVNSQADDEVETDRKVAEVEFGQLKVTLVDLKEMCLVVSAACWCRILGHSLVSKREGEFKAMKCVPLMTRSWHKCLGSVARLTPMPHPVWVHDPTTRLPTHRPSFRKYLCFHFLYLKVNVSTGHLENNGTHESNIALD